MGRVLALDFGTKRIGIAISDENRKIAFPRGYVSPKQRGELIQLIGNEAVEQVLIGLPKSLSGKETKSTKAVREFARWLRQNTQVKIEFVDERFSTREAEQKLREAGTSSKNRKTKIDSVSAYVLLEAYLKKFRN